MESPLWSSHSRMASVASTSPRLYVSSQLRASSRCVDVLTGHSNVVLNHREAAARIVNLPGEARHRRDLLEAETATADELVVDHLEQVDPLL